MHYCVGGATKFYGERRCCGSASRILAKLTTLAEFLLRGRSHMPNLNHTMCVLSTSIKYMGTRGSDHTEPWTSEPYRYLPVSDEPLLAELRLHLQRMALHPFPLPMGIMLDEKDRERSRCIRCDTCDGFPCMVDAKADAHIIGVRPALNYPNVTLFTDTKALRLLTSSLGPRSDQCRC